MGEEVETAALTALFEPFRQGALAWPERVAFLRARRGAALTEMPPTQLVCEQSFKPDADALSSAGLNVSADLGDKVDSFPLVLVLPPRQRDEARALLARAMRLAGPKGIVVAAAANSAGARSHEADLERLCGHVATLSKHKCRVFWRTNRSDSERNFVAPPHPNPLPSGEGTHETLIEEWLALDAPRPILEGRFVSRPGVFAWDRVDAASELLIAELPTSLAGAAADLGSGFGYLSRELLAKCPNIASLDVYEAEARALDLARRNLAADASRVAIDYRWHDVTTGLPKTYDVIVTNPPFHTSNGADDPGLGRRFIAAAAHALKPGGKLMLVANRHLPYEAVLNASFGSVRIATQRYGFKIIEATRSGGGR